MRSDAGDGLRLSAPGSSKLLPNLRIETYEPPEGVPPAREARIVSLIQGHYFHYPYLHQLSARDRSHFVAVDGADQVLGYASYKVVGRYAYCANLLVAPAARGRGVGRALDDQRFASLRKRGHQAYVSCLCEDAGSQKLKRALGLRPVCVKLGHQVNFVREGEVGSAVVFADGDIDIGAPTAAHLSIDEDQRRIRSVIPESGGLGGLRPHDDLYYQEALVGPRWAAILAQDPKWVHVGADLDLATNRWHFLFQFRNQRYDDGLARRPTLLVAFDAMLAALPRPPAAGAQGRSS